MQIRPNIWILAFTRDSQIANDTQITIGNGRVKRVGITKRVGVVVDEMLSWYGESVNICKNVSDVI